MTVEGRWLNYFILFFSNKNTFYHDWLMHYIVKLGRLGTWRCSDISCVKCMRCTNKVIKYVKRHKNCKIMWIHVLKKVLLQGRSASKVSALSFLWLYSCVGACESVHTFAYITLSYFLPTSTALFVWLIVCLFVAWVTCIAWVALSCSELYWSCCSDF